MNRRASELQRGHNDLRSRGDARTTFDMCDSEHVAATIRARSEFTHMVVDHFGRDGPARPEENGVTAVATAPVRMDPIFYS